MLFKKPESATSAAESAPQLSPFSATYSILSEGTTDEPPDLGAFSTVLRTLATFQQQPPQPNTTQQRATSLSPFSTRDLIHTEDSDSDVALSTVWSHDPIRSYLSSDDNAPDHHHHHHHHHHHDGSDHDPISLTEGEDDKVLAQAGAGPSLGMLDSALYFLATERAKLTNGNGNSNSTKRDPSTSDHQLSKTPWRHVVSPRRRRRRKRKLRNAEPAGLATIAPSPDSSVELSSSPDSRRQTPEKPGLYRRTFSHSTPNLLAQSTPADPAFDQLRELAVKLSSDFPEDTRALSKLPKVSVNPITEETFADPRSPITSKSKDAPITHVFIDHSNILIGFLSFLKKNPGNRRKLGRTHLSHAALTLTLERGRKVERRVMAASSPLYQPMNTAEQLDYEVHVFMRVPHQHTDGSEKTHKSKRSNSSNHEIDSSASLARSPPRGRSFHKRNSSNSNTLPAIQLNNTSNNNTPNNGISSRIRYREQGVDELLQLKLHQSIIDVEHPPPGSTIILATGDGNMGEFNEDGFVGCVRSALKKGWKVELYAFRSTLSHVWEKAFGDSEWKDRFRIVGLEKYGSDLLLI